ncbi:MAG: hypothetical protein FWF84_01365 [Kiritimatiellaeota bacterium]|nr:hypothetical protein [Kiritimatiellota bacterium]
MLAAIIELGSTSSRMAVGQLSRDGAFQIVESLEQLIGLGRDTFTAQSISHETTEQAVVSILSFLEVIKPYAIEPSRFRIVASSAVREARNCVEFVDRIRIATGYTIELLDEPEVAHLVYRAMSESLSRQSFFRKGNTLAIEVGGGNTQTLLFQKGRVTATHEYRLGSLRIERDLKGYQLSSQTESILREHLSPTLSLIASKLVDIPRLSIVALGSELRFACHALNPAWDEAELGEVTVSALEDFTRSILVKTPEETARTYNMSLEHAENLAPALYVQVSLARAIGVRKILIGEGSLRHGALLSLLDTEGWDTEFRRQLTSSADAIAERYGVDVRHARHVADYAQTLLEALREVTAFTEREEMILDVASRLHEIGLFVNDRAYHKHSCYLIENSEIFGMRTQELRLAARVARYHRHATPSVAHEEYRTLSPDERLTVSKLAAILRVANVLDNLSPSRALAFDATVSGSQFRIAVHSMLNLTLTRSHLAERSGMFRNVFGLTVALHSGLELD